ncbi:uncharacterized protein LOC110924753 [Helianthus annuus]|uniref:uncharacterized protein LOC110924753 n=1 Tax=Helianthus annuus TaxID=4232 RepID=UPI000B907C20|nr:uncharacterized protein LOC110924753 [Helianthus annuus]
MVEWLCAGDSNTSYFHNSVKSRNARNKIHCIHDVHGNRFDGDDIPAALLDHYSTFLGTDQLVQNFNGEDLFVNTLNQDTADHMVRQVTRAEVKKAIFSIGENKAPGPDGFTSAFFKHAWILWVMSKIITDRIKGSLDKLVNIIQSAFIPGRKISNNILLTQELMHNYHLNRGPPRCAFKIDIQKVYDTVSWQFLESSLHNFGFHYKMVNWIMTCVTMVSYSLSINGELHGYFAGKRGL